MEAAEFVLFLYSFRWLYGVKHFIRDTFVYLHRDRSQLGTVLKGGFAEQYDYVRKHFACDHLQVGSATRAQNTEISARI